MRFTPGPLELLVLAGVCVLLLLPVAGITYLIWMLASSGRRREDE